MRLIKNMVGATGFALAILCMASIIMMVGMLIFKFVLRPFSVFVFG